MTDVIQIVKEIAIANGMKPILADAASINYEVSNIDLTDGKPILYIRDDGFTPLYEKNMLTGEINHKISLFLCRKFENDTMSYIGETYQQKYTARIQPLKEMIWNFLLSSDWCQGQTQHILNGDIIPLRNFLTANLDGVSCDLVINTWGQ